MFDHFCGQQSLKDVLLKPLEREQEKIVSSRLEFTNSKLNQQLR